MTATNHALGFRPSHLPALTRCIHHQQREGKSEARDRGAGTHGKIAQLCQLVAFMGKNVTLGNIEAEPPEIQFAASILIQCVRDGWRIFAIEQLVDILDDAGEKITEGTIDLVLERNREYLIIDWKTGDKSDYSAQLDSYRVGWLDLHPEATSVRTLVAYVDLRETQSLDTPLIEAAQGVQTLWENWRTRDLNENYTINDYCPYCALRGDCPAWRSEASTALSHVSQLPSSENESLGLQRFADTVVTAKVDSLKNDPVSLEAFLLAWERCKTLVDDEWNLKESLKTHMQTGFKADHFILVVVKDKKEVIESVDPEGYLQKVVKEIGTNNAAGAISVDPHKALAAWKAFTDKPFPMTFTQKITDKPGYSYVRVKGKQGRGDAAKKRKELE